MALGSVALGLSVSAPAATPALDPAPGAGETGTAAAGRPQAKKKSRKPRPRLVDAAAKLQRRATKRWPQSFAGVWIDRGRIFVAFTEGAGKRTRKLRQRSAKPKKVKKATGVVFDDSLLALEATIDQASADRAAGVFKPPPGIVALPTVPYDLTVDIQRNTVVAIHEFVTAQRRLAFQARYGDKVVVEQGQLNEPFACTRANCGSSIRGGLESNLEAKPRGCTTGFVVRHRGSVKNLVLSAAHCTVGDQKFDKGAPRWTGSPFRNYGFVFLDIYGGPVDAEVHKVSSSFDARKPWVYVNAARPGGLVDEVAKLPDLVEGMRVCKSGKTTGYTCGPVIDTDYRPSAALDHMVTFGACSWHGDSGGPVWREFKKRGTTKPGIEAVGLLQGGPHPPPGLKGINRCDEQGNFKPEFGSPFSTFSHIDYIDTALPVNVLRGRDLKK